MSVKLKPCPFCGAEGTLQNWACGDHYYVECLNPECTGDPCTDDFDTEEEAIAAWNKRAGDE